jgi:hypothetical protein
VIKEAGQTVCLFLLRVYRQGLKQSGGDGERLANLAIMSLIY